MLSMVGIPQHDHQFRNGRLGHFGKLPPAPVLIPLRRFRRIFRVFHSIHYTIFLLKTQLYKERPHKIPDVFLAKKE